MNTKKNKSAGIPSPPAPLLWAQLGNAVRRFREDLQLTQTEFLIRFGEGTKRDAYKKAANSMSGWENGLNSVPAALLFNVWRAGYSVDQLFAASAMRAAVKRGLSDAHLLMDAVGDAIVSGQETAGYSQASNAEGQSSGKKESVVDFPTRSTKRNKRNVR